ncbi:MAG: hypothetical protein IT450_16755 [Phycisphaerales bacterium]|nr:hypothetical protein [Phycisphaerales bacterium]
MFRRNPLDITFGRIDEAWRRCNLPGVDIHLHLAFTGRIDIERLALAYVKLLKRYPIVDAVRRGDRWQAGPAPRPHEAIHEVLAADFARTAETLLNSRIAGAAPPFQLHIIRGNDDGDGEDPGDRLIVRWPHALADARGGVTLLEEIARLDRDRTPLSDLASAGDELRDDFGALGMNARGSEDALHEKQRGGRSTHPILHLVSSRPLPGERVGLEVRTLTPDQTRAAIAASVQTCGIARVADYLRATGIVVLDSLIPGQKPSNAAYSTLHLVDNRKRRDPAPVCHNVFSTIPVIVPAAIAQDRAAVGDLIQTAARDALERGDPAARLRKLRLLARLPHPLVARTMAWMLLSGRRWLPTGLASAPSLPLGFMGPPGRDLAEFCGTRLTGIYGVRVPSLHAGHAINLNLAEDRLTIAMSFFEPRFPRPLASEFVSRFAARVTE